MDSPDPERLPVHESSLSRARGAANVVRLGAIVGLTVDPAFVALSEVL